MRRVKTGQNLHSSSPEVRILLERTTQKTILENRLQSQSGNVPMKRNRYHSLEAAGGIDCLEAVGLVKNSVYASVRTRTFDVENQASYHKTMKARVVSGKNLPHFPKTLAYRKCEQHLRFWFRCYSPIPLWATWVKKKIYRMKQKEKSTW